MRKIWVLNLNSSLLLVVREKNNFVFSTGLKREKDPKKNLRTINLIKLN